MSCRFPGGVTDPESFWQLLKNGVDAITEVPASRWDADAFYDPNPDAAGKIYTRYAGFLAEVDQFDPQFFGISPREAVSLDPQQRLLLEVGWEALENAGQVHDKLVGSQTGVFIGVTANDYTHLIAQSSNDLSQFDSYFLSGNTLNAIAGRLSYTLGLQGPCMVIDTACSSSLVAVHLACQSLRSGESNMALVGGTNLILSPQPNIAICRARMLAKDGRCKTFDAAADGYVRGEGCGVVVLKRLSDAKADGDNILALIRGSAVNQDGASSGFTVPNGPAQQSVIRQALAQAKIAPVEIDYVEAHGTGTSLGDPIEVNAASAVLGEKRLPEQPFIMGTVKTNIGHLEAAAGIAGLMKVVLALQHEQIPQHLHLKQPNPHIPWDELPVRIPTEQIPWSRSDKKRLAGVSSFGVSGTNAHIVVEEAPAKASIPDNDIEPQKGERPWHLLTLSAKTETAMKQLAHKTRTSKIPVVSINWDRWKNVGMAVGFEAMYKKKMGEYPIGGMTPSEGMEAFRRILSGGILPQFIVSIADFNAIANINAVVKDTNGLPELEKPVSSMDIHERPNLLNAYVPPENETQQNIAEIWQKVLWIRQVGIHDDFSDLGGDSLIAIQVISRLREVMGVEIKVRTLFEAPTVAAMSEHIETIRWATLGASPADDEKQVEGVL